MSASSSCSVPGVEGPPELLLLADDRAEDLRATLLEERIRVGHDVDDDCRGLVEERLAPAEEPAMADGAPDDPAQDVATALVRGQDAVGDQERRRAAVIGDDLIAEPLDLEGVGIVAQELAHPGMDRDEQVGVVVRGDLLERRWRCAPAHARVDAGLRERRERPVRVELELHEDEVPDLEPARAVLRVIGHAEIALAELCAAVVVDLRAWPARPDIGHPPPVLLVAGREVAPPDEPLGRQPDLVAPDVMGKVVGRVHGRRAAGRPAARGHGSGSSQAKWIVSRLK